MSCPFFPTDFTGKSQELRKTKEDLLREAGTESN